ncbi:MAG: YtcA family lipoprotein [Terracidiphilus sp.]
MSTNHESFERSNAHRLLISLMASVFALAISGCSGPPVFNILGSYFPSWLVCLAISIGLTFVAHVFVTTKKLADQLWPLPIVYSALLCFFSCTLWLIFFI